MTATLCMNVRVTNFDAPTASAMVIHASANIDDLLVVDHDVEDDVFGESNCVEENSSSLSTSTGMPESGRAMTRLLSRSHSACDLTDADKLSVSALDTPRRNSSGECPQPSALERSPRTTPTIQEHKEPALNGHVRHNKGHRGSKDSSQNQLSPVTVQFPTPQGWKQPQHVPQDKEDTFSVLLQTTAERVLNKLKSRQQDLDEDYPRQRYHKRPSHGLTPSVPRKLQPIMRDGGKTPRPDSELQSANGDSAMSPLSVA